ncbi:hypothetical protein B0O99DRAFT_557695 [Bisporella sp. PMI_857]|nr:hypothetical protein B0O99DRAFT_557695 [Bisporella sp. PMI_857]
MLEVRIMQMKERDNQVWWYGNDKTDGLLRLISVNDLLSTDAAITLSEWRGLDLSRSGPERPRYAAISHAWEPSDAVKELSMAANRPLKILIDGNKRHIVSWHGLRQAAKAAERLGCEHIWLDLVCLNQVSDNDKKAQIKNMGNIYEKAKAVIIMPGGVAAAQRPEDEALWITRAWTLQEAVLCHNTYVLVLRTTPTLGRGYDSSYVDDDLAVYTLKSLVGGKGTNVSTKTSFNVHCFGHDSTVKSLQAILEAGDNLAMKRSAAWRSIWLRRSKREQDMVFSVMHLLGVEIKVDYSKSRDYLIRELAWRASSLPSFLDIGSLPFWDGYGLLPQLPSFTEHERPFVRFGNRDMDAHEFIHGSTYISKFDLKILTSSWPLIKGDFICARIFEIQRQKSGRPCGPYICCHGETHEFIARHEVHGTHAVVLGEEAYYPHGPYADTKFIGPTVFFIERSEPGKWVKLQGRTQIPRSFLRKERSHVMIGGYSEGGIASCVCGRPEMWASPSGAGGNSNVLPPISLSVRDPGIVTDRGGFSAPLGYTGDKRPSPGYSFGQGGFGFRWFH